MARRSISREAVGPEATGAEQSGLAARSKIAVFADSHRLVSRAGGLPLVQTLRLTGLDKALAERLERWRPGRAVHNPAKIITDLALTPALGGNGLGDIAMLRCYWQIFDLSGLDDDVTPGQQPMLVDLRQS
ncbi:hypothetical protein ACWEPN_01395 [Nonomuraea wenchangensis]